ncbi:DUF2177 family protein [Candidatus Saccharibacteria bacterium]|nr:DUF2177 family protein [Candidatus Saccharibacteria bacterium]
MTFAYAYLVALGLFGLFDAIWLSVVANGFYKSKIGHLLADKPNFTVAITFYLIYIFAIIYFVVYPAINGQSSIWEVALKGAILGFVMYATYDLTNHATLKNWPAVLTVVDMAWGTIVTASVATITYLIFR